MPTAGVTPARFELSSRIASLELTVVASDFRSVASGVGRLSADVAPGIYQLVCRAGPVIERQLVMLRPGEVHVDHDLHVSFPSAAPIAGTSSSHEYHMELAREASVIAEAQPGADSGLVLMVRDVRGRAGPPLLPEDVAALSLLDAELRPVADFRRGWQLRQDDAAAAWSRGLRSGGYVLRTTPVALPDGHPRSAARSAVDQSIWLSPGWKTIVFLTLGDAGPDPASASVHLIELGLDWEPFEREVASALELAQWGLREGRSVLPDDLEQLLLGSKFRNPMLGIIGAHSVLLRPRVDLELLDVVLRNLDSLVPGHPDVLGLRSLAEDAAAWAGGDGTGTSIASATSALRWPQGATVDWPPMLLASYQALATRDARDPGAIRDGSVAERVAPYLSVHGVWTSWVPFGRQPFAAPAEAFPARDAEASPADARGSVPRASPTWVLPALAADPGILRTRFADRAAKRVAGYLAAVAELEEPDMLPERFATLSPQEIGVATRLPAATVDRALEHIGSAIPAPPADNARGSDRGGGGKGGGPGPFGRVLPAILVVSAVLVAAAVAVGLLGPRPPAADDDAVAPTRRRAVTTDRATRRPAASSERPVPSDTATPTVLVTTPPPEGERPSVPVLEFSPAEVDFGSSPLEQPVASRLDFVTHVPTSIVDTALAGDTPDDFGIEGLGCRGLALASGDRCQVDLVFRPQGVGGREATLIVTTADGIRHEIRLVGVGEEPIPTEEATPQAPG